MPHLFRYAEPADAPAVRRLVESAYRGEASRVGWTTEADFLDGQRVDPEGVLEAIAKPDSYVLLADSGPTLDACAHIEKRNEACYFGMFAVRPDAQGAGLGKAVLTEAEHRARTLWQSESMRMTVIDLRDDLIAWYRRRGYRRTGEHAPFPYGDERFGIPRRDDLRFEWLVKDLTVLSRTS
ncbi:MAG TPA: GNAT family N-acetyltransferase [Gammaproteobacteria bacterium]|nr:GNAT family N-acetyltransferase [Gammaproteobacteria bacterium]